MRAIDLYAGIGGWSLGLRLAGIEVVRSYEWWQPAIETHNQNLGGCAGSIDIRKLDLASLPCDIDLVVGSPPCTQFSYANRGGAGDIVDGLKDLVCFFEVVEHLKPKYWVMENVPRVAKVLEHGFNDRSHPLYRFRKLRPTIRVLDMSEFGTPQARRRCIAGVLPFDLLDSYSERISPLTLGDIVEALAGPIVVDPIWGVALPRTKVSETETEAPLNAEEKRMNREAKLYHPVYNNMSFPDDLKVPARTVTATCTRVSRESIVIDDPRVPGLYRRLNIRERACLQGFPITYQFFGRSFSEKVKMVGNAIPPPFTYLVACAALGVPSATLKAHTSVGADLRLPAQKPAVTAPDQEGRTYPVNRRFRTALRNLRFKSGMRFELANNPSLNGTTWRVSFFFGPSRDIREIELDSELLAQLQESNFIGGLLSAAGHAFAEVERLLWETGSDRLQSTWTRRADGVGPYQIADALADLAAVLVDRLTQAPSDVRHTATGFVLEAAAEGEVGDTIPGSRKLAHNAIHILSGLIVGSWFNTHAWHEEQRAAA